MTARPDPVEVARNLVGELFPEARQAWLSGSLVLGHGTATSDLDIPVLLPEGEVHRESLVHSGWPVELFVHTEASMRRFVAQDRERRRPSLARMVSTGLPLLPGDDGAAALRAECAAALAIGPGPLPPADLDHDRYLLTDLLDDLAGGGTPAVQDAIVVEVWRATAELLLATAGHWSGAGKWLVREVEAYDGAQGTAYAARLHAALHEAMAGDPEPLTVLADEVLSPVGGRLWAGFTARAQAPQGEL